MGDDRGTSKTNRENCQGDMGLCDNMGLKTTEKLTFMLTDWVTWALMTTWKFITFDKDYKNYAPNAFSSQSIPIHTPLKHPLPVSKGRMDYPTHSDCACALGLNPGGQQVFSALTLPYYQYYSLVD